MGRRRPPGRLAMRNKRALFAVPYVGWMALFVLAPIVMVVIDRKRTGQNYSN